jgi:hypothetical protein
MRRRVRLNSPEKTRRMTILFEFSVQMLPICKSEPLLIGKAAPLEADG